MLTMALTDKQAEVAKIVGDVFGIYSSEAMVLDKLFKVGVDFEKSFFGIKGTFNGKIYSIGLPLSITALQNGTGSKASLQTSKGLLSKYLSDLNKTVEGAPVVQGTTKKTPSNLKFADAAYPVTYPPTGLAGGEVEAKPTKVKPHNPVLPGVIKLRDAEVLGQQVYGTSSSSVYRTVAVNPKVKVAVKRDGTSMGCRVELAPNLEYSDQEMLAKRIENAGFNWKGDYGSVHFNLVNLSAARVLGALLGGMNIKFDQQLTTDDELNALNKDET